MVLATADFQFEARKPADRPDRWTVRPALASVIVVFILLVLISLPGIISFVLIPLTFIGLPMLGAGFLLIALALSTMGRGRFAASILVAVLLPVLLWKPFMLAADYVHLGLTVWTGAGQLGSNAKPDGSPFAVYDWSVGLAGGGATFLIYDVTDEIALPPHLHKQPMAVEHGFGEPCAGKVMHLLDHYYVCNF